MYIVLIYNLMDFSLFLFYFALFVIGVHKFHLFYHEYCFLIKKLFIFILYIKSLI